MENEKKIKTKFGNILYLRFFHGIFYPKKWDGRWQPIYKYFLVFSYKI